MDKKNLNRNLICFILLFYLQPICLFSQTGSGLTLSEIMFRSVDTDCEFIEVYNLSAIDTVDLYNFQIKYQTSSADFILGAEDTTLLPPGAFAVILEGDYNFSEGIYNQFIPEAALVLKIQDNAFGSSGMSNTGDRTISLLNLEGDTLEVYTYSADNQAGISDEKKILNKDNTYTNWGNSKDVNGTPGLRNSISPSNFDLAAVKVEIFPPAPVEGDDIELRVTVKNIGLSDARNYSVQLFIDENKDSVGQPGESIFSQSYLNLISGDSIIIPVPISGLVKGVYGLITELNFQPDEDLSNNSVYSIIYVSPEPNSFNDIVINELMYAPAGDEPEWIEIYNNTDEDIDLRGWVIADQSSKGAISSEQLLIPAGNFVILSDDESIKDFYEITVPIAVMNLPSLNNSGDKLTLRDSLSGTIDSLDYLPAWGGTGGKSLERVYPEGSSVDESNWGSSQSINGATPGEINSITPRNFDLSITSVWAEFRYAVVGNTIPVYVTVLNKGKNMADIYSLKLYEDINKDSISQNEELIKEFYGSALSSGDSFLIQFNIDSYSAGRNYYIVQLEYQPDELLTNNTAYLNFEGVVLNEIRGDLVINEIMYAPKSPEPEWIELYNKSSKLIELKNYQIADYSDTLSILTYSKILAADEFVVIAKDSLILTKYEIFSPLIVSNFPTLNNSGDRLVILDSLDRVIDSLEYSSALGGEEGRSIERIDPNIPATEGSNWYTSENNLGATPGSINSISRKEYDISIVDIVLDPEFPLQGENVSLSARVKNFGKQRADFILLLYEDINLDNKPDLFLETSAALSLNALDSINYTFNFRVLNLLEIRGFYITADFTSDQDTSDNYFYVTVLPGYSPSSVILNEIMFVPQGGEPEWVEIYNNSDQDINLRDWTISDVLASPSVCKITNEDINLSPGSYLLAAKDSSVFNYHKIIPSKLIITNFANLNNDLDGIVIKDHRDVTIDSVFYDQSWHSAAGYSLERKSARVQSNLSGNWTHSTDIEGSTPGRINSVTPKNYDVCVRAISFTPGFPVSEEAIHINAHLYNNGSHTAEDFELIFYYGEGTSQHILSTNTGLTLSPFDSITITSLTSFVLYEKILISVKVLFSNDEDALNNFAQKFAVPGFPGNTLLINEVMYNSAVNEPEWIEIINNSGAGINLKNWSISDLLPAPRKNVFAHNDFYLEPGDFMVISSDTSDFHFNNGVLLCEADFGSLSNSEDGVIIYDFRDAPIDSLKYKAEWSGERGYSIERISFHSLTTDSTNWTPSLNISGGTPGKRNSISDIPGYAFNEIVINEIMYDPDPGKSEFIEIYNLKDDFVELGGWRLEDNSGDYYKLSTHSLMLPPGGFFVLAADSSILYNYSWLKDHPFITILDEPSLGLPNSGEKIFIKDLYGNIIDSLFYTDYWHNENISITKNRSLERINPQFKSNEKTNWSTSVNEYGGSPGKQNSIFVQGLSGGTKISVSPNPFSPDNDGYEDHTVINYNLSQTLAQIRVKIYDSQGRLVRTLVNNKPSGAKGSLIFDGLNEEGNPLRIGIYIIFLEAINNSSGIVETVKEVVVVARKL